MRTFSAPPPRHLFVCCNRRPDGDPLGPGCGSFGDEVYAALKQRVAREHRTASVWVTRTYCLGLCARRGTTVADQPRGALLVEVMPGDVDAVFEASGRVDRR